MLFFVGLPLGLLTLFLPSYYWARELPKIRASVFSEQYPEKRLVYFTLQSLSFLWGLFYIFILTPSVFSTLGTRPVAMFFLGFMLGAGISIADGFTEILSSVLIIRSINLSRNTSQRSYFVYDPEVKTVGKKRISLVGIALLSWIIITIYSVLA